MFSDDSTAALAAENRQLREVREKKLRKAEKRRRKKRRKKAKKEAKRERRRLRKELKKARKKEKELREPDSSDTSDFDTTDSDASDRPGRGAWRDERRMARVRQHPGRPSRRAVEIVPPCYNERKPFFVPVKNKRGPKANNRFTHRPSFMSNIQTMEIVDSAVRQDGLMTPYLAIHGLVDGAMYRKAAWQLANKKTRKPLFFTDKKGKGKGKSGGGGGGGGGGGAGASSSSQPSSFGPSNPLANDPVALKATCMRFILSQVDPKSNLGEALAILNDEEGLNALGMYMQYARLPNKEVEIDTLVAAAIKPPPSVDDGRPKKRARSASPTHHRHSAGGGAGATQRDIFDLLSEAGSDLSEASDM